LASHVIAFGSDSYLWPPTARSSDSFSAVTGLSLVAALAGFVPAMRASSVRLISALRRE